MIIPPSSSLQSVAGLTGTPGLPQLVQAGLAPLNCVAQGVTIQVPTKPFGTNTTDSASCEFVLANAGTSPSLGYIDVWASESNPSSVTDWGAIINPMLAAGSRRFYFGPHGAFPFTTPIILDGLFNVVFEGDGGVPAWRTQNDIAVLARGYLLWKGAATSSPPISIKGAAVGVTFRGIGVYYDNSGGNLTGPLIGCGGTSIKPRFHECDLRSWQNGPQTALAIISVDNTVEAEIFGCTIGGAQWGVLGLQTSFSNVVGIRDCVFANHAIGHLGNIGQMWSIGPDNTFEMWNAGNGETPYVIYDNFTSNQPTADFIFFGNWAGDKSTSTPTLIKQSVHAPWDAIFSGNFLASSPGGPIFSFAGGGTLSIVNNPKIDSNNNAGPIIDLGDTTAGAQVWNIANIHGNNWVCTGGEAVINRAGHNQVRVYGNGKGASALEQVPIPSHEYIQILDREPQPTVTAGPALGTGPTVSIHGKDGAFFLNLQPGTSPGTGHLCTVTFGTPYPVPPGSPVSGQIMLEMTPVLNNQFQAAGVYQEFATNGTSLGSVTISCKYALTDWLLLNCRVSVL